MSVSLRKIKADLLADKKRAAVLGCLLLIALVVGVRAVISSGPRRAVAAPRSVAAAPNAAQAQVVRAPTEIVAALKPRPELPDARELRDLFTGPLVIVAQAPPNGDEGGKSEAGPADNPIEQPDPAAIRARLEEEASRLVLRSTILGASPMAVVRAPGVEHASPIRIGDQVAGFTLVEIHARAITLERDGMQVTIAQNGAPKP